MGAARKQPRALGVRAAWSIPATGFQVGPAFWYALKVVNILEPPSESNTLRWTDISIEFIQDR